MCAFRYERTPIPEDPGPERAEGFGEILHAYTKEEAVLEAQRCLQCAMPFCVQACPITQDCRGYIARVAANDFDGAARLTIRDNAMATVLCKTCYHYCEEDCVMGGKGVPIAIRHLKRAALEFGKSDLLYVPGPPRAERIAVLGGGPAGLTCAWDLALRGYRVTVFESSGALGGQTLTIPRYHLDGTELDADLARFRDLGITFVVGQRSGPEFSPESLLAQGYAAVYLAVGASGTRSLGIPGEALPGVFAALDFLRSINQGPDGLFGRKERSVVVVGGGDVAMDAVRSSLRLAREGAVRLAYRRGQEEMTAGSEELTEAIQEGVTFLFHRTPVQIVGTSQVEGIVLRATAPGPPDAKGRPTLVEVPGSEETIACDTVIVAAGETASVGDLPKELDLDTRSHPWAQGRQGELMTDVPGVFASGGKSVVHAMAAGEAAAEAIATYVAERSATPKVPRPDPLGGPVRPKAPDGYGGPTWHL